MIKICIGCSSKFISKINKPKAKWCNKKCFHKTYKVTEDTRLKQRLSHLGIKRKRMEKIKRANGYFAIYKPEHPNAHKQGYILEHRYIMSESLGRPLKKNEVVHHLNHDITDNRIENLELCTSAGQHTKLYHPESIINSRIINIGRRPPNYNRIEKECTFCKTKFETTAGTSGKIFCSRRCMYNSRKGIKPKNITGLLLGRGWNKGIPMTWSKSGIESHNYKHGKYCKKI